MKITTIVLCVIALGLVAFAYFKRQEIAVRGLSTTGTMLLRMSPMLIAAFVIAGQLQALLPREFVAGWLGEEAGIRGIFIACLAGVLTPGGPYVALPIAVALLGAGADIGCVVAYLVAWTMWGLNGLAFEIAILGPQLTLAKRLVTLPFPPLAGILVQSVLRLRP